MTRKLLQTLVCLCFVNLVLAQVPANDLIENAVEVPLGDFVDAGLRLDLATADGVGGSDCPVDAFQRVYYKFTATFDTEVDISISDPDNFIIDLGGSFVIPYTAPDLSQTDETNLTVVPGACGLNTSSSFVAQAGQSYYVQVARQNDADRPTDVNFSLVDLSQFTPDNDLVENAYLLDTGFFAQGGLRLDAATDTGDGTPACDLGTSKRIYYKYSSVSESSVEIDLLDPQGGVVDANSSFVIAFEAPDLSQTDESNFTSIPDSPCSFGTLVSFTAEPNKSYYVVISREADLGRTSSVQWNIVTEGLEADRNVLLELYNATDGANWNFPAGTEWDINDPLSTWFGVGLTNGRVTNLSLQNLGLSGSLPASITDLSELQFANFSSNNLSGTLPDFSGLQNLESLNIQNNNYSFADIETNLTGNETIETFTFSPQFSPDAELDLEPAIGSNVQLEMSAISGTDVSYQWYFTRDFDQVLDDEPVNGADTRLFDINNLQEEDLNQYICIATSAAIPELEIRRRPINLFGPVSQQERDALVAFYNAMDGDNWSENANWLSNEPVHTWDHVSVAGNKVTGINAFFKQFSGVIPEAIGDLPHLTELSLADFGITGELPAALYTLTNLQRLRLQATDNTGAISEDIGNLSQLREIRFLANNFSGAIPQSISTLTELRSIVIEGGERNGNINDFSGTLPDLSNLTNLQTVSFLNCNLEGTFPDISNLTELRSLNLTGNSLFGVIPDITAFPTPEQLSIFISNNFFNFTELSSLVNNGVTYNVLNYSPQKTRDEEEQVESPPGEVIVLTVDDTGIDRNRQENANTNVYEWFKDDVALPNSNSTTYTIEDAQPENSGTYYCQITNPTLPDLVIRRADISLSIEPNRVGIVGLAANGWPTAENPTPDITMTDNGDGTYSLNAFPLTTGGLKFRQNESWDVNWGAATGDANFPSGNLLLGGADIAVECGVYDILFDLNNNTYTFTATTGAPESIGLVGPGATGAWGDNGVSDIMLSDNGFGKHSICGVTLPGGDVKFRENQQWVPNNWGGDAFFADGTPVTAVIEGDPIVVPSGIYDVVFDLNNNTYSFTNVGNFTQIELTGSALASDVELTTPDDVNYSLELTVFNSGTVVFREVGTTDTFGANAFPSGTATPGGDPIPVTAGTYFVSYNRNTGAYNFSFARVGLVGPAVSQWPDGANATPDVLMNTTDGDTYTLEDLVLSEGEFKFRQELAWSVNWGGDGFPQGNLVLNGADNIVVTAENAGTYDVTFSRTAGTYSFVGAALSISEESYHSFSLYPNPVKNELTLAIQTLSEAAEVQIYNLLGQLVSQQQILDLETSISTEALESGVYMLKLINGDRVQQQKFIKE